MPIAHSYAREIPTLYYPRSSAFIGGSTFFTAIVGAKTALRAWPIGRRGLF
jgi:hypothetical protein